MSVCNIGNSKEDKEFAKAWSELSGQEKYDLVTSVPATAVRLLNNTNPTINGRKVNIVDIKPSGDSYSITYKVGNKVSKADTSMGSPFDQGKGSNEGVRTLLSDLEQVKELKENIDQSVVDLVNNPDQMLALGKELAEMGNVPINPEHKNELLARLAGMKEGMKQFMPNINVHINKKASKNGGIAELSTGFSGDIYIGVGPGKSHKNPLEVYVHELYHALTFYAIESRDPKLASVVRDIQNIKNEFLANTTAEKLSYALGRGEGSIKEGQKILDYLASKDVGLHEFVAYAMTNEAVMKVLKSTTSKKREVEGNFLTRMIGAIQALLKGIMNKARKVPTDNDLSRMMWLTHKLVQANNRALENKRDGLMMRIIAEYGDTQEKLKDWVKNSKTGQRLVNETPKKTGEGVVSGALYLAKLTGSAFFNEKSKRALETSASLLGYGILKPEGTIQTVVRDASESDTFQDLVEDMGLQSTLIDQHRENIAIHTASSIQNAFEEQLTEEQDIAITDALIDTDAVSIYYDYDMVELLADDRNIDSEMKKLQDELKSKVDTSTYNYYEQQIKGLSLYMREGLGTSVQLLNAENIAKMLNTAYELEDVDARVVELIDKLVSLDALRNSSKASKKIVKEMMDLDRNGVDTVMAYVNGHKEHAEKTLFSMPGDRMHIVKGYAKEVFSRDMEGQVAPLADEREMRKKGYKLYKKLTNHPAHNNVEMAYYVTTTNVRQNLHRVALRYTDRVSRGTGIRDTYRYAEDELVNIKAERTIKKIEIRNRELVESLRRGEVTIEKLVKDKKDNVLPLLDRSGKARDYRYVMSKKEKEELYKQDRRASQVLGRTFASTYDKAESKTFNQRLMEIVLADAKKNIEGRKGTIGRNDKEYVLIEKHSNEEEVRELWRMLPKTVQAENMNGLYVRRDMMHSILGYRELSIMDAKLVEKFPEGMKYAIKMAEMVWKEIVKVAKIDIILRVPEVLIGNVISNFMYSVLTGSSPITIAKLQMQGVQELKKYIADKSKLTTLEQKQVANRTTPEEDRMITALRNDIEMSSVAPLIDAGFYTTILEELEVGKGRNASMFTDMMDDKLKGVPEVLRNGLNWLYINEKTSVYKMMNTATQYSDFVARYAQYHILQKRGVSKAEALKIVRDAFINYNKPNSRAVEWANQMGLVMFTKYFTRIQKAIKHLFTGHPISAVLALSAQEFLVGDISDITDQSILVKDIGNSFYNPVDTFMRAITPSGAEAIIFGMNSVK